MDIFKNLKPFARFLDGKTLHVNGLYASLSLAAVIQDNVYKSKYIFLEK